MPSKRADIFDQPYVPIWCEGCDEQGYVFDKDVMTGAFFVVCPHCRYETSEVNCTKCGVGGEFVENIKERPHSWTCSTCKTEYSLPADFYEKPLALHLESDLPEDFRMALAAARNKHRGWWRAPLAILLLAVIPALLGGVVGSFFDPVMVVFGVVAGLAGTLCGIVVAASRLSWLEKTGFAIFLYFPIAVIAFLEHVWLAGLGTGLAYVAGLIYGFAYMRVGTWIEFGRNKTTAQQKG